MAIYGNTVGGFSPIKVMQLELEDGTVLEGVVAEDPPVIDATENDIRLGKKAITSMGVIEGQKVIPSYHTSQGVKIITAGNKITINNLLAYDGYDYTKLQAIICSYNTNLSNSVAAEMVSIDDKVYNVKSVESLATVVKDHNNKLVDFGIINNFNEPCIVRYLTYKEVE